MNPRDIIEEAMLGEAIGSTVNIVCPHCTEAWEIAGKPPHWKPDRSMSITRDHSGLLYNCFRASCGSRGFISSFDILGKPVKKKVFTPKEYKYRTEPAGEPLLKLVALSPEEIEEEGIMFAPDRGTYVFPIFNAHGGRIGVVDRSYSGRKPKAIAYWEEDALKAHFPQSFVFEGETVMVVEDIPSAIVGCRVLPTVALMGTGLSDELVYFLRQHFTNLIVALDADAAKQGIRMAQRYSLVFDNAVPVFLKEDLKNLRQDQAEQTLNNILAVI